MPLRSETLVAIAEEIAFFPVNSADIDQHVAALGPLLVEFKKLRSLDLKGCEPSLVFEPVLE
jgi:hypothetical protein